MSSLKQKIDITVETHRKGGAIKAVGAEVGTLKQGFTGLGTAASMALRVGVAGAAVLAGKALADASRVAGEFEHSMARVGALSRSTGSKDFAALTDAAKELGATTSFSASQAATGMQALAMAGYSANQIISAMPGLLNTAAAGQVGLGRTADIVSDIMSGFGIEAENTGKIGDILTGTFISSNTTLESLGETMKVVGPIAAANGQNLHIMAAAAGLMGTAGIKGSEAGTALRGTLVRLAAPTDSAARLMKDLGIQTRDANGQLLPLPALIGNIQTGLGRLDAKDATQAIKELIGMEAMGGFQVLLDAGPDAMETFIDRLGEVGVAASVAKTQMDTLVGATAEFNSAWEAWQIQIGEVLNIPREQVLRFATGIIRENTVARQAAREAPETDKISRARVAQMDMPWGLIGYDIRTGFPLESSLKRLNPVQRQYLSQVPGDEAIESWPDFKVYFDAKREEDAADFKQFLEGISVNPAEILNISAGGLQPGEGVKISAGFTKAIEADTEAIKANTKALTRVSLGSFLSAIPQPLSAGLSVDQRKAASQIRTDYTRIGPAAGLGLTGVPVGGHMGTTPIMGRVGMTLGELDAATDRLAKGYQRIGENVGISMMTGLKQSIQANDDVDLEIPFKKTGLEAGQVLSSSFEYELTGAIAKILQGEDLKSALSDFGKGMQSEISYQLAANISGKLSGAIKEPLEAFADAAAGTIRDRLAAGGAIIGEGFKKVFGGLLEDRWSSGEFLPSYFKEHIGPLFEVGGVGIGGRLGGGITAGLTTYFAGKTLQQLGVDIDDKVVVAASISFAAIEFFDDGSDERAALVANLSGATQAGFLAANIAGLFGAGGRIGAPLGAAIGFLVFGAIGATVGGTIGTIIDAFAGSGDEKKAKADRKAVSEYAAIIQQTRGLGGLIEEAGGAENVGRWMAHEGFIDTANRLKEGALDLMITNELVATGASNLEAQATLFKIKAFAGVDTLMSGGTGNMGPYSTQDMDAFRSALAVWQELEYNDLLIPFAAGGPIPIEEELARRQVFRWPRGTDGDPDHKAAQNTGFKRTFERPPLPSVYDLMADTMIQSKEAATLSAVASGLSPADIQMAAGSSLSSSEVLFRLQSGTGGLTVKGDKILNDRGQTLATIVPASQRMASNRLTRSANSNKTAEQIRAELEARARGRDNVDDSTMLNFIGPHGVPAGHDGPGFQGGGRNSATAQAVNNYAVHIHANDTQSVKVFAEDELWPLLQQFMKRDGVQGVGFVPEQAIIKGAA